MTLHRLDALELDNLLKKVGFSDTLQTTSPTGHIRRRTAWAKAMAESGGYYDITSLEPNPNGSVDYGLFQFNDYAHRASIGPELWAQILDPVVNATIAYQKTGSGANWSAWGLGLSGWAGSLHDSNLAAWTQIQKIFQSWYDRYPTELAAAITAASSPAVHLAYLHYGMGGAAQPAAKPDITTYQKALRTFLASRNRLGSLNPSGATGYYGHETEAMTEAVYRYQATATSNLTWLREPLHEPGPKMLAAVGLKVAV